MMTADRIPHRLAIVALAIVSALGLSCQAQPAAETQKVAMSDGVKLATDVYLPAKGERFSTVLIRTPYNKDGMKASAGNLTNTGDPHPVAGKSRVATNTLHLSERYSSHVSLPVYTGDTAVERN